jgi:ribonuclease BN (tRNA processing enzyme)
MIVEFFGVRGSHAVTAPNFQKFGGNTSCVLVTVAGRRLVLDAGTGLINLARRFFQQGPPFDATILFSHYHHDHLAGLSYFGPLFVPSAHFALAGPRMGGLGLGQVLDAYLAQPFSPFQPDDMAARKSLHTLSERYELVFLRGESAPRLVETSDPDRPSADAVEVRVRVLTGLGHPRNGVMFYRIEHDGRSLVYATDTEGFAGGDQRLVRFAQGADLLVHDAMYLHTKYVGAPVPPQGWGHSTPEMALDVALQAGVQRLCLFHHDPANDDEALVALEAAAQQRLPQAFAAREGLTVEI